MDDLRTRGDGTGGLQHDACQPESNADALSVAYPHPDPNADADDGI